MAYIGNQPVLQSTQFREEFFPTSNQTAFNTGGFHPSAVSVTRNGVLLSESDYTKGSDNVTITLNSAAVSGDVVVIRGNRSLAQGVSVSESRVEYTWQSGDTVVQLNADVIPAYTDVYLNGVKLAAADYSINASTKQVSFTSAPAVGDVIAVVHKNETSALVALPLKDSSGAAILSESGSTVTLANVDTATIGSNALVVSANGNVGVGSTNPGTKLVVATSTSATAISVSNSFATSEWQHASNDLYISNYQASGSAIFRTNGTERMRIDSSGNLGLTNFSNIARIKAQNPISLADDGSISVTTLCGASIVSAYDQGSGEGIACFVTYASTAIVVGQSSNTANSDTDNKLCIFKNANSHTTTVKNRLGTTRNFSISVIGSTSN